ncbi:MAG: cupin domain-containing protein [Cyanobacteria bacterium SID2]|nr:cupin domain-containing protein [Cyanobacteria bacterium SID2]MBP0004953.1 cupin domain-containing protein [Cyanobacteria bacterium SBC]
MSAITPPDTPFHAKLQDFIEYPDGGVLSKAIVKDSACQYTLFCLAKGTDIEEHTSTRNATITAIEGTGTLTLDGKLILLKPDTFVFMPANTPHALTASENLAFLLVLSV